MHPCNISNKMFWECFNGFRLLLSLQNLLIRCRSLFCLCIEIKWSRLQLCAFHCQLCAFHCHQRLITYFKQRRLITDASNDTNKSLGLSGVSAGPLANKVREMRRNISRIQMLDCFNEFCTGDPTQHSSGSMVGLCPSMDPCNSSV